MQRSRGFTLIELMVVMAIIAIATAGATLALRDGAEARLDREAVRLAALLEAARAQSRASGLPAWWQVQPPGFVFVGLPAGTETQPALPAGWLEPTLVISGGRLDTLRQGDSASVVLGPEPMLPPQQVTIALPDAPGRQRTIASDGLHPFAVTGAAVQP